MPVTSVVITSPPGKSCAYATRGPGDLPRLRAPRQVPAGRPFRSSSGVQGAQPPPGGTGGVPLFSKTSEGGPGGTTAQAKPDPPLKEGAGQTKTIRPQRRADAGVWGSCHTPLAKYEQLCYSTPMKSATGPLLFLGACRITHVLGANHRVSPCGRGAEGTTRGARPSEEGWDRSECRCRAQALGSR